MTNFERMWGKLPYAMRQENNRKLYEAMGNIFDTFDNELALYDNMHVIDLATGLQLDAIGNNVGVPRITGQIDTVYRRRLKVFYASVYFVPNLDNFQYMIKNIMGYYPNNIKEGWKNAPFESAFLELDIVIPMDDTDEILLDFDRLYGAGCRLKWNKFRRVEIGYNFIGDTNTCGFTEILESLDVIDIPYEGFTSIYMNYIGDDNTTGFIEPAQNENVIATSQPL